MNKMQIKTLINFNEMAKRVPPNQWQYFMEFKMKNTKYLRTLNSYPSKLPTIDWIYYKKNVKQSAINDIEKMKKIYENFEIAYPKDVYSHQIDEQKLKVQNEITEFVLKSKERIKLYKCEIQRLQNIMPFDQMTMEDFFIAFPEHAIDFQNKPTFWPHTIDERSATENDTFSYNKIEISSSHSQNNNALFNKNEPNTNCNEIDKKSTILNV